MRELKFRAWDKTNKVMIESYCHVGMDGNVYTILYQDPTISYEVQQYTGLKDRR